MRRSLRTYIFHPLTDFMLQSPSKPTRYAILVNKQWRISFEWSENHAFDVYFEDYH